MKTKLKIVVFALGVALEVASTVIAIIEVSDAMKKKNRVSKFISAWSNYAGAASIALLAMAKSV